MPKLLFIAIFLLLAEIDSISAVTINQVAVEDTMIKVSDHSLHFIITRGGEPTILLEAGGGADASQWESIQQKLALQTKATIISYDRAGFGSSELPGDPYDIKKEVQDLHHCLTVLGVGKLVLVAHSYGAFLNQAYQFMYPGALVGIVLADPNNTIFADSIGLKVLMNIPFDTTKELTKRQKADVRQTIAFSKTTETVKAMPYSASLPIILISAGKDWWPFPAWNRMWRNSHYSLANASPGRILRKAEASAHNIPKDQPDMIIEAILQILNTNAKK